MGLLEITINIVAFFLQVIYLVRAIKKFNKNPIDFSALFAFLYIAFYSSAAWNYLFDLNLFKNEFFIYYEVFPTKFEASSVNLISVIIMWAFEFGYSMKRVVKAPIKRTLVINKSKMEFIQVLLIICWFMITIYGFKSYGGSLRLFFSPARKTIYTSGYLISLVVIIPTTLFTLNLVNDKISKYKKTILTIFYSVMLMLTQISLGQRREIINGLIYIFIMLMLSRRIKNNAIFDIINNNMIRKKIISLGFLVILLVPILWYLRTYTTQVQRGATEIVMPWKVRGWFELLFGSSTTGFQTTFIIDDFTKQYGEFWLHSIIFLITIVLPRSIFPWKLMTITKTMQFAFGIQGNLSLFYINDIYYNFGILSIIASFLFGYFLSKIYNMNLKSENLYSKAYAVILLSQIILLFKNGFAQYIIMIFQYFLVFKLSYIFIYRKNKPEVIIGK